MPLRQSSKRFRPASNYNTESSEPPQKKGKSTCALSQKPALFDNIDESSSYQSAQNSREILRELGGDDNNSPLSSLDTDPQAHSSRQLPSEKNFSKETQVYYENEEDEEDEDLEFEDVDLAIEPTSAAPPEDLEDLDLTLIRDNRVSLVNSLDLKKGPTKKERAIRTACHRVHVQCLLWHNAIRNSWLCDQEVQAILLSHLTPRLWEEFEQWRRNSGINSCAKERASMDRTRKENEKPLDKKKGKQRIKRESRDWGSAAKRLEEGAVNMAHGDPLLRLMRVLITWWKQRFRIVVPGIRKVGYMDLERLDKICKVHAENPADAIRFGERIESLESFRRCAQECAGSRDVGAQLFTSLLRALGLQARMVASLQPLGFTWTKAEEALLESDIKKRDYMVVETANLAKKKDYVHVSDCLRKKQSRPKAKAIESDEYTENLDDNDNSSVEVIPFEEEIMKPPSTARFDKSLDYPHYWTEVLSPVTNKFLPVDPLIKLIIGTNRQLIESLEPRGLKADKAKQVIAYVVGFLQDGSAKDITLRYLKNNALPGRTKGMRMPPEKIPVYNRHGKLMRHDLWDWFKHVMKGYERGKLNTNFLLTEADILEDSTDLKPKRPQKKMKEGQETLQYYKNSKEFVLERHLKREEALLMTAEPVKVFVAKSKAGEKMKENVYLRKDVVAVKSAETWHKQGRVPMQGEEPLKRVPYRAATINRKLAIEEEEKTTGQKVLQGLYSFEQTNWIIPPPIRNGVIPKNEYGNIDLFVEHMLPQGAVHIPYRSAMRLCKRLRIDFAEAVVDFDFGHRMAAPVIQGVVVAEEHYDRVMEEITKDEAEKARKEDEKKRKTALDTWRRFLRGMRITERLRRDYGGVEEMEVFTNQSIQSSQPMNQPDPLVTTREAKHKKAMEGGFFLDEKAFDDHIEEAGRELEHSKFFNSIKQPRKFDGESDSNTDGELEIEYGKANLEYGESKNSPHLSSSELSESFETLSICTSSSS